MTVKKLQLEETLGVKIQTHVETQSLSSATRLPSEAKKQKNNCAKRMKMQGALLWNRVR